MNHSKYISKKFEVLPHIPALQPYHSRSLSLHLLLHIYHLPQFVVGSVYHSALQSLQPGQHSSLVKRTNKHTKTIHCFSRFEKYK